MKSLVFSVFTVFVLLLSVNEGFAQHDEGDININAGIGLAPVLGTGTAGLPPITVSAEYGINDDVSLGGMVGYATYGQDVAGFGSWKYTYIILGGRGSYHFGNSDKFDPYVGAFLGYFLGSSSFDGDDAFGTSSTPTIGGFGWGAHLGARYRFTDNIGAFGELGYGISVLNLGLNVKLP